MGLPPSGESHLIGTGSGRVTKAGTNVNCNVRHVTCVTCVTGLTGDSKTTCKHSNNNKVDTPHEPPVNVINISKRKLTEHELQLLSLGLSFVPTPPLRKFSRDALISDFHDLADTYITKYTRTASGTSHGTLQRTLSNVERGLSSLNVTRTKDNLTPTQRRALANLSNDPALVICKADKGDATVVMDTERYVTMAWAHLNDRDTYCPLTEDPTADIARHFNAYLDKCLKDEAIDGHTHDLLTLPTDTNTQTIYFLPKIHKTPLKIRPIVSCTSGPTHTASAYLDALLQPLMKSVPSFVLNSMDVLHTLEQTTLPPHTYLVTLDVESLYTNITHERAINTFTRHFKHHPRFVFFLDLLKHVLRNNVFTFDGHYFKQTCGLAMGTKLAPALATLVMAEVEQEFMAGEVLRPLLWRRYIDDILMFWSHSKKEFTDFFRRLNNHTHKIRFTHTLSHQSIDFLDLTLFKQSDFSRTGKLATKIFYKRTNTFTYPHGTSYWHGRTCRGIAIGEGIRALRNTSSKALFHIAKRRLLRRLKVRNYPKNAIRAVVDTRFEDRQLFLSRTTKTHIDKPLPLHTPFYQFRTNINDTIRERWKGIYDDPCLPYYLPTPPFLAYSNHKTIGKIVSHKRRTFDGKPPHPLAPKRFTLQKFNRPRPRHTLKRLVSTTARPAADTRGLRTHDNSCGNTRCLACPRLTSKDHIISRSTGVVFGLARGLNCLSQGIIYALTCKLCGKQYVGQTGRTLRQRFAQHRYRLTTAQLSLYSHFLRYHHITNLDVEIAVLERVSDPVDRLARENWWIANLSTTIPSGLNNPTITNPSPKTTPTLT